MKMGISRLCSFPYADHLDVVGLFPLKYLSLLLKVLVVCSSTDHDNNVPNPMLLILKSMVSQQIVRRDSARSRQQVSAA